MARISIEVHYDTLDGDHGSVDGIIVTCSRCGHEVEVFGTGEASIKRAAIMLREECPNREENFYEEL